LRNKISSFSTEKYRFSTGPSEIRIWILDFGFWILYFGFWILDFGFWILDFGFWILDFGFWILDFGSIFGLNPTIQIQLSGRPFYTIREKEFLCFVFYE
jgi:hypothetical protein